MSATLSTQSSGYFSRPQSTSPFKRIHNWSSHASSSKHIQPVEKTTKSSSKNLKQDFNDDLSSDKPLSEAVMLCPKEILENEEDNSENPNVNYFFQKGKKLRIKGDFFNAVKSYKKVLSFDEDHFPSLINLGICYLKLGLITEAISTFDYAIKINENSFIPYFNKALAHIYLQQYSEAVKCMNNAYIILNDKAPEELFRIRALALYRSGKIAAALDDIQRNHTPLKPKNSQIASTSIEIEERTSNEKINKSVRTEHVEKERRVNRSFDQIYEKPVIWKIPHTIKDFDTRRLNTRSVTPSMKSPMRNREIKTVTRPQTRQKPKFFFERRTEKRKSTIQNVSPRVSIKQSEIHSPANFDKWFSPIKVPESQAELLKEDASGCFHNDLSFSQIKENILRNHEIHNKIQEKFSLLQIKLEEDAKKQVAKLNDDFLPLLTSGLSEQNIQSIKKEYLKEKSKRNFEEIDQIIRNLKFFARFSKEVRISLLKISELHHYHSGMVIFKQGDQGDMMYVIVRGSVSIEKTTEEFGNQNIVVNSLYDGSQFGELALINSIRSEGQVNERLATVITSEPSELISIPKLEYNRILLNQLKSNMEAKIMFLSKLPLFKGVDPIFLIPLASNIEPVTYDFNEVILEKGEQPKGLYIIMKGNAAVITEGYSVKDRTGSEFANVKIRKPSPKPFYMGNINPPEKEIKNKDPQVDPIERLINKEINDADDKTWVKINKFVSEADKELIGKEKYLYKDRILFAALQTNDFFGGRSLIEGEVLHNTTTDYSIEAKKVSIEPSKFSVVAQSSSCEVFIITKNQAGYLNEKVADQMKTIIQKSYEVDCPPEIDPEVMDKLFTKWQQFRVDLVENIRRNNYVDRRRAGFPFVRA
ncbi:unnamed protein product [Blepharisma stoltei]|uniref:Cyclic nucleotide-binding domain-containing protein n=1 Tax=Blepharisma stoltei TaxID=1481888 RepID=A0AAU9IF10_9CILI|nr:unnamed protein product [Blepharisma stoltei]